MIDASQVTAFATKLDRAAGLIEAEADQWARQWADEVATIMAAIAPRLTGELAASIRQISNGVIEVGARYGVYVDRGTSRTAPQPFVRPSIDRVKPRALDDAGRIAIKAID